MNLMMITLLTVGSAVGQVPSAGRESAAVEEYYDDCYDAHGHMGLSEHLRNKRAIHNTAPQTCYSPRFGCYHSNERHMHRYPAFHGTFYRQAYNYRNYFDYPWHAQPHEPTSLFSYNVGEDEPEPVAPDTLPPTPPTPPTPQARRPQPAVRPQAVAPTPRPAATPVSTKPALTPASAKPVAKPVAVPVPAKSQVSQSGYMAPASASRRISTTASLAVKPASADESISTRRIPGSTTNSR